MAPPQTWQFKNRSFRPTVCWKRLKTWRTKSTPVSLMEGLIWVPFWIRILQPPTSGLAKPRRSRNMLLVKGSSTDQVRERVSRIASSPRSERKSRSNVQSPPFHRAATQSAKASKCRTRYSKFRTMTRMKTLRRSKTSQTRVLMRKFQNPRRAPTAQQKLPGWSSSWVSPLLDK